MTNEIKPFNFEMYQNFKIVAKDFWESKAIPKGITNAEQLAMIMQAWLELWIWITQSLWGLCIINWIVSAYWTTAWMLMKRAWYDRKIVESSSKICKIKIWKWEESTASKIDEVDFVMYEAINAWISTKDNRVKYPKDMLYWKCLARARKRICPEALGWMPIYEDYQDIEVENKKFSDEDEKKVLENFVSVEPSVDIVEVKQTLDNLWLKEWV